MKPLYVLVYFLFISISVLSQSQPPCFFGPVTQDKMDQDPTYAQEVQQFRQNISSRLQQYQNQKSGSRAVRTLSVVVHVVYNTSAENVPQTYVDNMINTLNEDYRKLNSDLGNPRNDYVPVSGDAEIEFCLDQTIRVNTSQTCFDPNTERDDMKFNGSGGSNAVNTSEFLNIWIVDICGNTQGGTAGYAYLPTGGVVGSNVDGLVIDYDLGFNQGFGRTATHEIGHYLGLQHPWGSDANPSCGVDDGFNDTPNTSGPNYFCSASNSCNTPPPGDMFENFMDYSNCKTMFTQDQSDYMNLVLDQVRSGLLNSSGCSSTPTAPVANFAANKQSICPGETVDFSDNSSGSVTSWSWTFNGGTPSSSNQQNPSITYNIPGTYEVALTVNGPNGNDTETKTNYITVLSAQNLPLVEGFEGNTFVPSGFELLNFDNNTSWERTTSASGYNQSSASAFINNYNYDASGNQDIILTPNYNFSNASNAYLKYDYAYAFYGSPQYSDTLIIAFSDDCGENYYSLKSFGGADLATAPNNTNSFVPGGNDWETDSLDISFLAGESNVQFAFINLNGYGNNLYLDNINIDQAVVNGPPVTDFTASATTVNVGGQVNFTDLSSNGPTSWSWTFNGGTPGTSNQQNPSVTYNTVGTYQVSLTATNSFGSDTETKTAYIEVVNNPTTGCDTLTNFAPSDTLTAYGTQEGGYITGHNGYGDIAKADFFTANAGDELTQVTFLFAVAQQGAGTATVEAKIWDADGAGGIPNTELASENMPLSSIVSAVNNGNGIVTVAFPSVTLNGDFYAGIEFTYGNGDTVALASNLDGNTNPGTAWEKWDAGGWFDMNTTWNGLNIAQVIIPVVCEPVAPTPPVANFSANVTSGCEGIAVNFSDQSTDNPASWSWTFNGGSPGTSNQQNPTVTYNTAGTYNVSLTVSNSDGSDTKTSNAYITVTAPPSLSGSVDDLSCNGSGDGAIDLTVSGVGPFNYEWSNGPLTEDISGLNAGNYSVTVTDDNGCVSSETFNVAEPNAIVISGSINNADCGQNNGSISLSVNGGLAPYTYNWSVTGSASTINNLGAGNYTVTVADDNNCTNTRTFSVSNTNAPAVTVLKTEISCAIVADGALNASVSGGTPPYSFIWSNQSTDSLIQNLGAGNYGVTVTDGNNCLAIANAQLLAPDTLEAIITSNRPTCGSNNGSLTVNPQGGTPPYFYVWNNGSNSAALNNIGQGNYSVTLTDARNCQSIKSYKLDAFNAPTLNLSTTDIACSGTGGSITTTVSGGVSPYDYLWSNGATNTDLNSVSAGTYSLTVTDDAGCSVTALATISSDAPTVTVNKNDVLACYGDNSGSINLIVNSGTPPYSYLWSNGASSQNLSGLVGGTYEVTVTDDANCQIIETIDINQPDSLDVNLITEDSTGSASVSTSGGTGPYTYTWSSGQQGNATVDGLAPGIYELTVSDFNACQKIIEFTIGNGTSIESFLEDSNWKLFPNPARNMLYVEHSKLPGVEIEYNILNAIGAKVKPTLIKTDQKISVNIEDLSAGIYLLQIRYKGEVAVKRFVVAE